MLFIFWRLVARCGAGLLVGFVSLVCHALPVASDRVIVEERVLDVAALGAGLSILRDPGGLRTLSEVSAPAAARDFRPMPGGIADGYTSTAVAGVPFDEKAGRFAHDGGRVTDPASGVAVTGTPGLGGHASGRSIRGRAPGG